MNAVMPTYGHPTVSFEKGEGAYLFDTEGRRYLDFAAGIAVNSLGHSHPHLVAALKDQAERLWHVSNLYNIPDQVRLAERLCGMSFADAVFFCNSGTEAMEGSVKAARRYHAANGSPEKWRSITLESSFHGRTLAMLSASKNPKHLDGFGDPADGFDIVPVHNMNALRDAITPETAAIVVEPIQGEGGLRPLEDAYLKELRAAADEFGLLLVFDEVQTGFGRTGRLFAHEWSGVTPDIMGCAKGIAGGFPCGAILATQAVADTMTAGTHGSTFGGNPLAMAVANATLDVLTGDGFLDTVLQSSAKLVAGLKDLAARYDTVLEDVRGKGLMLGMIVKAPHTNAALGEAAREQGLLTVVAGENVLRMLPPLVIGETEIAEALAAMDKACASLASADND
ncbi:MAG: aspartate aminotransferase family protein [Alphaproteobacteria bacterium]|jgi:acetylornithine/N-succinyldiaminopimelate aminotransferase|nr:aspartate aminotransferase family protein [Alphaproteobacteria bacterium]